MEHSGPFRGIVSRLKPFKHGSDAAGGAGGCPAPASARAARVQRCSHEAVCTPPSPAADTPRLAGQKFQGYAVPGGRTPGALTAGRTLLTAAARCVRRRACSFEHRMKTPQSQQMASAATAVLLAADHTCGAANTRPLHAHTRPRPSLPRRRATRMPFRRVCVGGGHAIRAAQGHRSRRGAASRCCAGDRDASGGLSVDVCYPAVSRPACSCDAAGLHACATAPRTHTHTARRR